MTNQSNISFQADGSPFSTQFDDIYFDTESGCLQSEQVFINGNNIDAQLTSGAEKIVIAETGFGTGLNFLLTLKRYERLSQNHTVANLHFISTEKFPLTREQLIRSLECLPQLEHYSQQLIAQYPDTVEETLSLTFANGRVSVDVLIGDAADMFARIKCNKQGLVNAWYLDGFSPTKNPDMWRPALFEQLGRLSKVEATVATFTVAGMVRRGLNNNGFRVIKQGYGGKKKEILVGKFQQSARLGKAYQLRPLRNKPQHVTIIGGGIASACLAYALVQQHIKVTVFCKDEALAQGASSNKIGAIYPLIHQTQDDISIFYQQALTHAKAFYQHILEQGFHFAHQWCGLLELSFNEKLLKRQTGLAEKALWPTSLIHEVDAKRASEIAGISLKDSGLFIPDAGWVAPQELVNAIFNAAEATTLLKIKTKVEINKLTQQADKRWQLQTNKGVLKASTLIIAGGAESMHIEPFSKLPMYPVRGQVSSLTTNEDIGALNTVVCHKGYLTPKHSNLHCIGATFDKDRTDIIADEISDDYNLRMLAESMGTTFGWSKQDIVDRKARLRCMTPDHLPIAGPMADIEQYPELYPHLAKDKNWHYSDPAPYIDNLYLVSGLGARGLCSAPLLAEILAADLAGSPYPVDNNMLFNLSSCRFVVRDIIKRKLKTNQE